MPSKQAGKPPLLFPEILGEKRATEGMVLALRIPEGLAYFAGHFDEIAVVPGVVQIQWAVHYARHYLGVTGTFSQMEVIKFKELLLPGQCLEVTVLSKPYLGRFSPQSSHILRVLFISSVLQLEQ